MDFFAYSHKFVYICSQFLEERHFLHIIYPMKKLLFCLVFSCTTILVSAINVTTNLNPFAYNLSAELSADQTTLTVKYCLNADVTSLKVVIKNGESDVYTHTCSGEFLKKTTADKPYFSPYQLSIPVSQLGAGTYTWQIEVTGEGRNEVQVYSQDGKTAYTYSLYLPSSVDIVKDPTSFNYGKVIVVEGSHSGKGNSNYASKDIGAGLYVFNPDFTPILNRNDKQGFNGGSKTWGDETNSYFASTTYAPRRVRVSEDGRIFVASMYKHSGTTHKYIHGDILWEVDPYFSKWTTVMGAGVGGATYDITKITSGGVTYYQNQLETSGGSFIAAPCAGLDVRGKGENLKLLLLSGDYRAFANNYQGFHLCEYNLGTASTWATIPSKEFNVTTENATTNPTKQLFATPTNSNVQYDKDGGVWCVSFRATASAEQPALVHKNADKSEDYRNTERDNTKNAGFRFNNDFTKVIIATTGKIGTVYDYTTKANGYFTNSTAIDMSAVGEYLNDFAWDNANNIYAVGNNGGVTQGSTTGGHVAVYCLPYSNSDVFTTPGPSDFTINCQEGLKYTVTTTVNDAAMGGVTGGGTIQSCTLCTVEATPNTNYRFVNWTMGGEVVSTDNPYTFMVTDGITITANFAPAVFNVTWWNLFQGGEDIYDKNENKNTKLWYLFMPYYNVEGSDPDRSLQNDFATGEHNVVGFCNTSTKTLLEDSDGPLYWLGQYIKSVVVNHSQLLTGYSNYNKCMFAFINRVGYAKNSSGYQYTTTDGYTTPSYLIDTLKRFANASVPSLWRPYWTNYACDLPSTIKYEDDLPVSWKQIEGPSSDYQEGEVTGQPTKTPSWYKWNTGKPNQLLAWREGDSITGPIVHQVDHDMTLYASYVDRHISEVKDNTDVIRLMQNSGYKNNPHALTVDRKLQAGMYNTICFPFTVYINDQTDNGVPHSGLAASHPLKGATVLNLIGTDKLYDESGDPVVVLNFEQVNKLEAGKPYLIKLAENQPSITEPIPFTGIAYDDLTYINGHQTITTDDGTISFHGMINPGVVTVAADAPTLILVDQNRLAVVSQNGEMKGLRGYFTLTPEMASLALDGRCYLSVSKPTPTDVEVLTDPQPKARQQVQKIMRNGQIFIIRDGETYTITGQKVR